MTIFGVESTCDETGIGIVEDGKTILYNSLSSSANLHKKYGGIVPEVAAREQLNVIIPMLRDAFGQIPLSRIDTFAVANGPGLIGSLLVGVETIKTLSFVTGKPVVGVNHLVGHIYSNWIDTKIQPKFPAVSLIVSGGHTDLVLVNNHASYKLLGSTRDDAAGEAFDKVARVLGLGYPGGPEIENLAREYVGKSSKKFPRPLSVLNNFDFSFSGLKTAVVREVENIKISKGAKVKIAFEFQEAVVDVLVTKTFNAFEKFSANSILIGGGVAANGRLRKKFDEKAKRNSVQVFYPRKNLSVDNGAMIAAAAYYNFTPIPFNKLVADSSIHFN